MISISGLILSRPENASVAKSGEIRPDHAHSEGLNVRYFSRKQPSKITELDSVWTAAYGEWRVSASPETSRSAATLVRGCF
jgi:hypothetical protein